MAKLNEAGETWDDDYGLDPARPSSPQSARERPDAIRIVRDVEYAVGEEFPTATRRELIDRIAAALSATSSDPAILVATALERIVEVATAGAKQTNDPDAKERFEWIKQRASSAPSVAGGEPAEDSSRKRKSS